MNDHDRPGAHSEIRFASLTPDLKLQFEEQGNPKGIPVIFLPGFSDSCLSYRPLMTEFPSRFRTIALTQRGHGDSSRPADGYATHRYADDLAAFMTVRDIPRAVIVGHSFGSLVAMRFAIDFPGRVLGLGLLGAFRTLVGNPGAKELWSGAIRDMSQAADPAFVREFQQSTLARPIPAERLESAVSESLKMPGRIWKVLLRSLLEDDFSSEIARIDAPTVVIFGARDEFTDRAEQDALVGAIRHAELVEFPGAGHAMHWEDPAGTAKVLARFCRSRIVAAA
jgi:pimeloyl-ACP methyl ester carboxylesterase